MGNTIIGFHSKKQPVVVKASANLRVASTMEIHEPRARATMIGIGVRTDGAIHLINKLMAEEALTPEIRGTLKLIASELKPINGTISKLQDVWDSNYVGRLYAAQETSKLMEVSKELLKLHVAEKDGEEKIAAYQAVYDVVRPRVSFEALTHDEDTFLRRLFAGSEVEGVHINKLEQKFSEEHPGYRLLEKKRKFDETDSEIEE